MSSMSNSTFEPPSTVQTRADGLRVDDRIFVRYDDEDLWAQVTAIKAADSPDRLLLELRLELDGAPVGACTHTPPLDRTYPRRLPTDRPTDAIPATTDDGLAEAAVLFRSDWDCNGTVSVHFPTRIARQLLGNRGWQQVRNDDGTHFAWKAPNGDRFWHTDDAVKFALTAECVGSPMIASPRSA
jgi:hypothetical protein